jgi:HlyD family secretion protein
VKAGQLCARIDPRPYQVVVDQDRAALIAARAQLVKDEANLTYARAASERQSQLLTDHLTSQDAADAARSTYQQVSAQVNLDRATIDQREASLRAAEVNLGYTRITSPVDGIVVTRNITQGQTVAASFQTPTLFLIATDLTQMQVDANVSESDIGQIKAGDTATFTVEAFPSHLFRGRVTQVRQSPQTIQNVVTYDVVVSAPNPQLLLKPGMTADVRIVTADLRDALRVPVEALRYWPASMPKPNQNQSQAQTVWTLKDGHPVAVRVGAGLSDDVYAQITSGALRAGEPVIIGERSGNSTAPSSAAAPRRRSPFL